MVEISMLYAMGNYGYLYLLVIFRSHIYLMYCIYSGNPAFVSNNLLKLLERDNHMLVSTATIIGIAPRFWFSANFLPSILLSRRTIN